MVRAGQGAWIEGKGKAMRTEGGKGQWYGKITDRNKGKAGNMDRALGHSRSMDREQELGREHEYTEKKLVEVAEQTIQMTNFD